jgi:hypothetical protein
LKNKTEEIIIADYYLQLTNYRNSCITLSDTLKDKHTIKNFRTNVFKKPLFKLPCGTVFENQRKCYSDIIVYLNHDGREACYICAVSEIKNHPEFKYFMDILNDTTYFRVPLSEIFDFDRGHALKRKEEIQNLINKITRKDGL